MGQHIYPLTFEPVFRDYIWGGRNLEALFGRRIPSGIVAESWEISGHASSPTRVVAGMWRGRTLPEVLTALGTELVGSNSAETLARGRFPLLVKLLDANLDLSVQVHPDDDYARVHEDGELGKTEIWYVLHAQPGCELIYGLARGATRETLRAALEARTPQAQLHRVRISAGDCIFIPAGTVHALLAGAVVAEIQQNSDATYRVYDWGRVGADGRPRPLHTEKAMEVTNYDQVEPSVVEPVLLDEAPGLRRERLVRCAQFSVERISMPAGGEFAGACDGSTFEIWGCIEGHGLVRWRGKPVDLEAIRFVLLPAALGEYTLYTNRPSTLLRAYVGERS